MHPEHPDRVPDTEHVALPGGNWADLKLSLKHGEALRIETAQLEADYDVKGELAMAAAMVRSELSATPAEWQKDHLEQTFNIIQFALNSYEKASETALLTPERRAQMAAAQLAREDAFAKVFTAAWSYPRSLTDWDDIDGAAVRILRVRSQRIWIRWQKELGERLKDEEDAAETPSSPPPAS